MQPKNKDFLELVLDSWDNVIAGLRSGEVVLENENELKCYFFHHCLGLMKERKFEKPYSIFVEYAINEEKYPKKSDLVLGKVVYAEFKYRNSINTKEINEVKGDISRLRKQTEEKGAFAGAFLMIDRTGRYERHITPFVEKIAPSAAFQWQLIEALEKKVKLHALKVVLISCG